MLRFIKSFFKKTDAPINTSPETPTITPVMIPPVVEPAKCGCGRSATGYCVGLHKLTAEEWAAHPDNPVKPAAKTTAPKKSAAEKPSASKAAKKPAAITAAPKKPRAKKQAK